MSATDPIVKGDQGAHASELPVFPLNLVLFPGGSLSLKIFEQRYQEMTKNCLRDDAPFGVCCIRDGQEVGAPAAHEAIGCSARIVDWEMPHPGLFHLNCIGETIFQLVDSHTQDNGLIHGHVEWLSDTDECVEPLEFDACRNALERVVKHIGARFVHGATAFDDPAWVSYRLAEILPVDAKVKQGLLEQRSTALRVSRIAELLQSA
jgi:Lon protease-like protein